LRLYAKNLHASFRDRLQRLFPSAQVIHHLNDMKKDARVAILLPPIKSIERMLVKVHEYRLDKTSKWPHSLSVGDVLRATIVCSDGDTLLEAWSLISSPTGFDVRPGNGRLKNLMATTLPRPPCMLINVIVDSDDGHRPVLAEVQIELRSIIELAMAQHKYYEIRRAKTVVEIIGARHGGVTVQKELSTVEANPTGGDRSKVHPADKYIDGGS